MAEVDGIEAPAEKSDFHRAERGGRPSNRQGSSGSVGPHSRRGKKRADPGNRCIAISDLECYIAS
jgi:hypothetical protein